MYVTYDEFISNGGLNPAELLQEKVEFLLELSSENADLFCFNRIGIDISRHSEFRQRLIKRAIILNTNSLIAQGESVWGGISSGDTAIVSQSSLGMSIKYAQTANQGSSNATATTLSSAARERLVRTGLAFTGI